MDLETKEIYLRSVVRKKKEEVVEDLRQLEQRWHKLWLSCAEWKCLLEVAIAQHWAVVSQASI